MSNELPKTYEPAAIEAEAYRVWLDENCFHAEPSSPGEPYSIVIPPPNVTGALHLGHAINSTLQDILIRKARMEGRNAVWIPGIDHAGIATQAVVEKQLKERDNLTRHDVGREGLVKRIWEWKQQYGDRIISQLKRLGCSCDWDRTRFTLDEMCAKAVRETFFKLFKDGLVYRGKRLVNWDVHLQTSISDDEIYHETVQTHLWHIKYPIVDSGEDPRLEVQVSGKSERPVAGMALEPQVSAQGTDEFGEPLQTFSDDEGSRIDLSNDNAPDPVDYNKTGLRTASTGPSPRPTFLVVATTRPETMLGDTAIAVHSEDPRWNWAIGKFVELPLTGRKIPIIADDILVDPKFGTGVVKVTPAHDPNDYSVWQRHLSQLDAIDIINIMNPDGTLNDAAGKYKGLALNKARHAVANDLKDQGLLIKEEPYETQVGHSDRSKTPIQPYLSDQWFVKMAPLAEPALRVVRDGTIQFFPERHAQQYLSWLGEKRDWPISRQLWWGHRIPVWTGDAKQLGMTIFAADAADAKVISPMTIHAGDAGNLHRTVKIGGVEISVQTAFVNEEQVAFVCVPPGSTKTEQELERLGFVQDPDVLDTWFSSALWPHSTLGWPEQTPELAKWYPTSVLLTGRDIITLWVARMVMMGMYNMGQRPMGVQPVSPAAGEVTTDHALANVENFDPKHREPEQTLPVHEYAQNTQGRDARGRAEDLGIPFYHVAINPTILDGKGERMSKSKGNGVDPVDVIDTHGADALRFTLATMATETQDVRMPVKKDAQGRNTSDKFDFGRNFCNKLWNASRFVISNLELTAALGSEAQARNQNNKTAERKQNSDSSSVNPALKSLPDRWIVSRFNATVDEANKALSAYRFDLYAKTCYDFFWRDFCDWYVEAVKPTLKTESGGNSLAIVTQILDGVLRLMHPLIPFITETIWWKLNELAPDRAGLGTVHKRLIHSAWPQAGTIDAQAEERFTLVQEIIVAIRNVRNEHKADPKKPVVVRLESGTIPWLKDEHRLIETLAVCRIHSEPDPNAIRVSAGGAEIYISGLIGPATDKLRQTTQKEALVRKIAAMKSRLGNEAYTAKAPAALVEETRQQLAQAEAELSKLE